MAVVRFVAIVTATFLAGTIFGLGTGVAWLARELGELLRTYVADGRLTATEASALIDEAVARAKGEQ
jgi:polyhydroxyalkanoate synthesis regulator phasin